jgi:hypothetical protein
MRDLTKLLFLPKRYCIIVEELNSKLQPLQLYNFQIPQRFLLEKY